MSERATKIEYILLEMDDGEGGVLAWGVHDPLEFARQSDGIVPEENADMVSHVRMIETDPPDGVDWCDVWYQPVKGEPNATLYRP